MMNDSALVELMNRTLTLRRGWQFLPLMVQGGGDRPDAGRAARRDDIRRCALRAARLAAKAISAGG